MSAYPSAIDFKGMTLVIEHNKHVHWQPLRWSTESGWLLFTFENNVQVNGPTLFLFASRGSPQDELLTECAQNCVYKHKNMCISPSIYMTVQTNLCRLYCNSCNRTCFRFSHSSVVLIKPLRALCTTTNHRVNRNTETYTGKIVHSN